ncbi:MAG TPA: iron-containing alcohol dehydrogenase [Casimicrobiaceae bacterium]|nr:iron-containing alcohol dehydrogenase [Casimicrobiaceae bacterium]
MSAAREAKPREGDSANALDAQCDPIAALLDGTWIDPDSGVPCRVDIACVAIEPTLEGREAALVESLRLGRRFAVVSDAITHDVAGARIGRALAPLGNVDAIRLPRGVHADDATVEAIRAASSRADALIAVGAGTINDLSKCAAARDGKPYAVFATAPSMNGYASANAAITIDGHKRSLPATLARGVFIDLAVFAKAPPRMIRAGLGDSLCRPTAQVDWLLSHVARDTPYRHAPFAVLAHDETALFDAPEALLAGDVDTMRALARTLVLSGMGMTLCGGSYPASQGEHLISHYLEMRGAGGSALHGEQVGVATLTMARLQEAMLEQCAPTLHATAMSARALQDHFGDDVGASCWRDFAPKRLDASSAAQLTERIARRWNDLRERAAHARVASERLADVLRRAGAPTGAADIGIDAATWRDAVRHARFLRDRYTFLDLADDSGSLAERFLH